MVDVPDRLYRRLIRRAEQTQRTVEAELLDMKRCGASPPAGWRRRAGKLERLRGKPSASR